MSSKVDITMNRSDEIRQLLAYSPAEVRQRARDTLIVCPHINALHERMAEDIAKDIEYSQDANPVSLILPVGPIWQYPILAELIGKRGLSLKNCWFFFMDEYCDLEGHAVPAEHPLSFKGTVERLFFANLPNNCGFLREQCIFPDEHNIESLPSLIAEHGGIKTCYGGIGIHGHLAFNEPEPNISQLSARKVRLNDFTVTINAIRAEIGGNLENFPRYAFTLGLKDILAAQEIRLYCRNAHGLDYATTALRLALFGEAGDDYPVTHLRQHGNYRIITDEDTLQSPKHII